MLSMNFRLKGTASRISSGSLSAEKVSPGSARLSATELTAMSLMKQPFKRGDIASKRQKAKGADFKRLEVCDERKFSSGKTRSFCPKQGPCFTADHEGCQCPDGP